MEYINLNYFISQINIYFFQNIFSPPSHTTWISSLSSRISFIFSYRTVLSSPDTFETRTIPSSENESVQSCCCTRSIFWRTFSCILLPFHLA